MTHERAIELMLRVKDGDEEAFAEIMRAYRSLVVWAIGKYTKDPRDVEDLCQETFLKLWGARARYEERAKLSSYLCRIAINAALNHRRTRARRRGMESLDDPAAALPVLIDPNPGPERLLIARQDLAAAVERFRRLRTNAQEILVRCRVDGEGYEQVAMALGLTLPALKTRLFRATQEVRAS